MDDSIHLKLNVFGRELVVQRESGAWRAYHPGADGKRRPARDITIPAALPADEVPGYLADLLHEHASERYPGVELID